MSRRPKPSVSKRQIAYATVQRWLGDPTLYDHKLPTFSLTAEQHQRLEVHIIAALNRWSDQQAKNRKKRAAR